MRSIATSPYWRPFPFPEKPGGYRPYFSRRNQSSWLGPTSIAPFVWIDAFDDASVGIPSRDTDNVNQLPASAASMMASAAKRARNKDNEVLTCVDATMRKTLGYRLHLSSPFTGEIPLYNVGSIFLHLPGMKGDPHNQ